MRLRLACVLLVAATCGPSAFVPAPRPPPRVFALSEVDERPEIVLTPPLRVPDTLRAGAGEGVALVRLVIDTAGNPELASITVVQSPDSGVARAARALVLKTLFRPGRVRGRVVRVMVDVPVEFSAGSSPPVTLHIAGDVYRAADLDERPRIVSAPPLVYPAPLLLSGVQGRVLVQAVIDSTGRVEEGSVEILESSDPGFNPAATDYVSRARFQPGRLQGRTVRVRFQLPIDFRLPTRH